MTPGTTPTHYFNLPMVISKDDVAKLRITYEQNGRKVLQKTKDECTFNEKQIIVKLKQEETLKFDENASVRMQLKLRTTGGDVIMSKIMKEITDVVLDKEMI